MQKPLRLLDLLVTGEFLSGAEIGRRLGISRAAVWKQINRLREDGVDIEASQSRGYRIPGGLVLLCEAEVRRNLSEFAASRVQIFDLLEVTDSTNDHAMGHIRGGGGDGYICVAERQTAGKGRRGRAWVSPYGGNIYLTTVKRFDGGAAAVEGLSLAIGVAVVNALRSMGCGGVQLKWPNDVLWERRKLGGILLEIVGDPAGLCDVVVGVGINANMPKFAEGVIDQPWADLQRILGQAVDRNRVIAALLSELLPLLEAFERVGFERYRGDWMAVDAFKGQQIRLNYGDQQIVGEAKGVSGSGALLIETEEGLKCYSGGEISLRAL